MLANAHTKLVNTKTS